MTHLCFPGGTEVKSLPPNARNARDMGLIPELGRDSGEGNGDPLQYSCLENSMDRGAWWATVHIFFIHLFVWIFRLLKET